MSRDWLAVYVSVLRKPKYRRLSLPARAALFHVWLLAGGQTPEATWDSHAELADVLDLDGYPPEALDELVTRGWLDQDDAGRVTVHDWDEHQLAATVAARRAYEADRKRDWRRRPPGSAADPLPPAPLSPNNTGTGQHNTGQVSPTVPEASGTRPGQEATTCPDCFDGPLDPRDPNVTRDRGQLWHRTCPSRAIVDAIAQDLASQVGDMHHVERLAS